MKAHSCRGCGSRFLIQRSRCPQCGSKEIKDLDLQDGRVILTTHLTATPDGFSDQLYLVLAEKEGTRFFCMSEEDVEPGTMVEVKEIDSTLICTAM